MKENRVSPFRKRRKELVVQISILLLIGYVFLMILNQFNFASTFVFHVENDAVQALRRPYKQIEGITPGAPSYVYLENYHTFCLFVAHRIWLTNVRCIQCQILS